MKYTMAEPAKQRPPDCNWPNPPIAVTTYCFGEISESERYRFETHLLECPHCWGEVQRLDALIRTIQGNKRVTQAFNAEIVGMIGVSGQLNTWFAGHLPHALVTSTLWAGMLAVSVFMEVAFRYAAFRTMAQTVAPLVLLCGAGAMALALAADWKLTSSGRRSGLAASSLLATAAALAMYAVVRPFLPAYPITEASFQTWTAQAAFLKDVVYCDLFATVFVLVPFHFIITLQRELTSGRYISTVELLSTDKYAVAPLGAPYIRVWLLGGLLVFGALYSIVSTAHLLEALKLTPFSNLFIHTIEIRWLLFLALGIECCWWYYAAVNELKRECRAVCRLAHKQ
jgi:hypothetical protein